MSRAKVLALVGVFAVLALALVVRPGARAAPVRADLAPLQRQAALAACPGGVGPDLPALTLTCLGGGPAVPLRGPASGRPTLVNVYGSWCGPCQDEMPLLVALAQRAGDRVALLGVDTEDEDRTALHFALDFGMHWPSVVDADGRVVRAFGGKVPVTLFLDGAGRVQYVQRTPFRSFEQLRGLVATHLGVRV